MSIATETQKITRNSFDINYETAGDILRPSWEAGGIKTPLGELGELVSMHGREFKAANRNAQGQVMFYHQLLQEFKALPDDARNMLALEIKDSVEGNQVISVGKYRGSDPMFARHTIELVLSHAPLSERFQAKIHRVEYDGNRRKEFGLPILGNIENTRRQQADVARMFSYMNLGLGDYYSSRA